MMMTTLTLPVVCLLLGVAMYIGCCSIPVPVPHIVETCGPIDGTVLDAQTSMPVRGGVTRVVE